MTDKLAALLALCEKTKAWYKGRHWAAVDEPDFETCEFIDALSPEVVGALVRMAMAARREPKALAEALRALDTALADEP